MNERGYGSAWLHKFQLGHRKAVIVRIPDSPVGRKPFDAFIFIEGTFMAIEFKMLGEGLLPHQAEALKLVKHNGGIAKVIYFSPRQKPVEEIL